MCYLRPNRKWGNSKSDTDYFFVKWRHLFLEIPRFVVRGEFFGACGDFVGNTKGAFRSFELKIVSMEMTKG